MTTVDHTLALHAEYDARRSTWSDIRDHLPTLYDAVCRYPQPRVLELGVRWGTSTSCLLAAVAKQAGHLWSVDIVQPTVPGWWDGTGLWTLTVGDDLDVEVLALQPDAVDVLFLDTSHVYEQTIAELREYVPRVRPGGVVLCHDTELDAPEAAAGQGPQFPVAAALDAYCAETGRTWTNITGCYGLGVIDIPSVT